MESSDASAEGRRLENCLLKTKRDAEEANNALDALRLEVSSNPLLLTLLG